MQYPRYGKRTDYTLIETLAHHLGSTEPDDRNAIDALPKGSATRAARLIGRGCLIRMDGPDPVTVQKANGLIRRAITETEQAPIQTRKGRTCRTMNYVGRLLVAQPNQVVGVRQQFHHEIIGQTKEVTKQLRTLHQSRTRGSIGRDIGIERQLFGERAQLVAIGSTSRQNHPNTLMVPALTHRDDHESAGTNSHDLVLLSTGKSGIVETDLIQIKSECLAFCCMDEKATARQNKTREKYSPDITLMSAHCDLVVRTTSTEKPGTWSTANMLIAEYHQQLGRSGVEELDMHSNGLVLSITMDDPRRMGTAALQSSFTQAA